MIFLFPYGAFADKNNYGSVVLDKVTSIYDGDTFRANINSWPRLIGERVPIRVSGVDTPELRGKCEQEVKLARIAKQRTVQLIREGKSVELHRMQRDKYFRIVAEVLIDGKSLGNTLVSEGLAKVYFGGKKKSWCG